MPFSKWVVPWFFFIIFFAPFGWKLCPLCWRIGLFASSSLLLLLHLFTEVLREWFIQKFLHGHAWFEFREVIRFLIFFYSVPMFLSGSVILAICNVPCSLPMVARCWVFGWKWFPWMCHFLDLVVEKWFLGSCWRPKGTIFEWSSSSRTIYCFKVRKATACGLQLGRENPKHWRKHFWNLASCSAYEDSLERMKKICEERFLCVHRLRNHQYGEIGFVEESRMTSAGWGYSLSLSLSFPFRLVFILLLPS